MAENVEMKENSISSMAISQLAYLAAYRRNGASGEISGVMKYQCNGRIGMSAKITLKWLNEMKSGWQRGGIGSESREAYGRRTEERHTLAACQQTGAKKMKISGRRWR
jgi:hypothetical protein